MKKRIFITGATSFLGKGLLDILKERYEIVALEHSKKLETKEGVKIIKGSLESISEWEDCLSGIDIIIHLAGATHATNGELYRKVNVAGTQNLINIAEKHTVKQFIFISTSAVGKNCGAYGESKKEAEELLKKSGLVYTILRVGPTYSNDFQGKEGLASLVKLAKKSFILPYLSDESFRLSPIHRDDVTNSIVSAVENPKAYFKTYTVTGPENLSTKEIFYRLLKHNKTKKLLIPMPTFLAKFIFYIFSDIFKMAAPDQMLRLLSKKEPLSGNVLTDLNVKPRYFLK